MQGSGIDICSTVPCNEDGFIAIPINAPADVVHVEVRRNEAKRHEHLPQLNELRLAAALGRHRRDRSQLLLESAAYRVWLDLDCFEHTGPPVGG